MDRTIKVLREQIEQVKQRIVRDKRPLGPLKSHQGHMPNGAAISLNDSYWNAIDIGGAWGGSEELTWFRVRFTVPNNWQDERLRLVLHLGVDPKRTGWPDQESLLYVDGKIKQGLDRYHGDYLLSPSANACDEYLIAVCASCLGREGMVYIPKIWQIDKAEVQVIDEDTEALYFDALVALEVAESLDPGSSEYVAITEALTNALNLLDFQSPNRLGFYGTVRNARGILHKQVYSTMQPVGPWKIACVGNAHIDVAWLWTVEETRRKCARTFATVLSLMDQYGEWHFIQSQPQLYEFLKRDYPGLYVRIASSIQQKRWEPTGAMWVEADTVLISGESLVRQILFGTRFFYSEFRVKNTLLWLPDSFGYTAALPQIIRKSGLKYFMTTKMSWNEFNRIPMDTFQWQGIDGSQVLTHLITAPMLHRRLQREVHTYRSETSVAQIQGAWEKYSQQDINKTVLYAYGHGDGGGGPTQEMLERLQRLMKLPGIGQCYHSQAEDFFDKLSSLPSKSWPVWDKELYFECHRGVYTTRAQSKRSNRKCELLYRDAEMFSAWAQVLGKPYPQTELNEGWKKLLRNQCHDIISGVCVPSVHEQCERDYAAIEAVGKQTRDAAIEHIISHVGTGGQELPAIFVFNSLSWKRTDIVTVEVAIIGTFDLIGPGGDCILYQVISSSLDAQVIAFEATVPSYGYAIYCIKTETPLSQSAVTSGKASACGNTLENQFFKIKISNRGEIISLLHKIANREVLADNCGKENTPANVFQFFQDKPLVYEAWDIDLSYYQKKLKPEVTKEGVSIIEPGPVRAGIEIKQRLKLGDRESIIKQRIYIYASVPRIDFETEVDWQEEQTLLKVAFPVNVHSDHATYDIQFGNIQRSTHWNTDRDMAQFEVWGHKWADLSDSQQSHGVSLLNDCKYGWDIKGNVMRLTLLRSPREPDPDVDRGKHRFTYSLYPHKGDWREGRTVHQAYQLNCPLVPVTAMVSPTTRSFSFIDVDCENIIIETVKRAENSNDIIVRIYESHGKDVDKVKLTFGLGIARATECNLMEVEEEENLHNVNLDGNQLAIHNVKKYEIVTLRIEFLQNTEGVASE